MATGEPYFYVNGTQLNAIRAGGPEDATAAGGAGLIADATSINGVNSIRTGASGSYGFGQVFWSGYNNTPTTNANSLVLRVKFLTWTGGYAHGVFSSACIHRQMFARLSIEGTGTPNVRGLYYNEAGQTCDTSIYSTGSASIVASTWHDLVFTWDGTTTANQVKFWIDGTNTDSATASRVYGISTTNLRSAIAVGIGENINNSHCVFDEIAWYDSVIDPTSVTFADSTSGSLNGASRTKYLFATPSIGFNNSTGGGATRKSL